MILQPRLQKSGNIWLGIKHLSAPCSLVIPCLLCLLLTSTTDTLLCVPKQDCFYYSYFPASLLVSSLRKFVLSLLTTYACISKYIQKQNDPDVYWFLGIAWRGINVFGLR